MPSPLFPSGSVQSRPIGEMALFSGHFNADDIRRIPGPVLVVTILRNPIERLLSNHYFWKRHRPEVIEKHSLEGPKVIKDGTLSDFLRSNTGHVLDTTNNMMARKLAGQVYAWPDGSWRARVGDKGFEVTDLQIVRGALGNLLSFDIYDDISALEDIYARIAEVYGMPPLNSIERLNARDLIDDKLEPVQEETITPEIKEMLERRTRLDNIVYQLALDHAWRTGRRPKE